MYLLRLFPLDKNQRIILEKSIESNNDDYGLWFQRFIWAPLGINIIVILVVIFTSNSETSFWVQLFNGRLSIMAISIISAMALLLVSKSNDQLKNFESYTVKLKRKVLLWSLFYLVANTIMLVLQNLYSYWPNLQYHIYVLASIFILIIFILTVFNSVYIFMITDEILINAASAIDVIINSNVKKLEDAINDY